MLLQWATEQHPSLDPQWSHHGPAAQPCSSTLTGLRRHALQHDRVKMMWTTGGEQETEARNGKCNTKSFDCCRSKKKKKKLSQLQPPETLIRNSFDYILLSMLRRACLFILVLCHARSCRWGINTTDTLINK